MLQMEEVVKFPKVSIKMKNWKTSCEVQTTSRLNEIIQPLHRPPLPTQPDKISLRLWNKNFLTQIYRNNQTFAFEMFLGYILGRKQIVQCRCFFLTANRKIFAPKFVKWERILTVLQEHIIFNVKWIEVCIVSELHCKKTIFCWFWDFLLEILKCSLSHAYKSHIRNWILVFEVIWIFKFWAYFYWNMWTNIKKLYTQNVSKKKNSKYEILNHLYFGPNSVF